ncbi:LysM peptidoglycan-binding domain-containing protein [Luteimonas sp. 3794]|uniref:LysM peptidoglycan-binding domain-containing protein n=1 Tax=Luteimonas sp. 3794 TaxID=2817730 RepID=UPI0028574B77|nr:LysM peptidoglycan-binding domain-containing protein [Luteimonas sp. 3794]MDR6992015.1 LysM repeat protein [Luteimonas sp. 3794]
MSINPTTSHSTSHLPPAPTAEPLRHTVQPAESLVQIANQYGVSTQDLLKANPQISNPDMVYPDDALVIPSRVTDSSSQGVSISNTGGISANQSTRSDARTTYTSDAGTVHQSTTSTSGNVSVNPDAGSVTASGGVAFNESVKSANGYGVSFGGGANASISGSVNTANGVTTYKASSDVSVFLKGGVSTPQAGLELGRTDGIRASYQVAMPADAGVDPLSVNPFDPQSMPVGATVTMNGSDYTTNEFKATFRNIATQTKVTDETGVSTVVARTGEDTVRVTAGPTEAVKAYNGVGVEFGIGNIMLGRNDSLSGATLRTAEFDLSNEAGQAAYNDFLATGTLPDANGGGVANVATVERLDYSSQTNLSAKLGPVNLSLDGAKNTGNMVVTTHADGSIERSVDLQYSGNVPMNISQRWDAAGNEIADARVYSFDVQVDANNVQLLNAALSGGLDGAPVAEGQTVTLGFSETQMNALAGQTAAAVDNGAHMSLGNLLGYMNTDGSYPTPAAWDFALSLGRNLGNSDYGLSERLFSISDGSTNGGFGDRSFARIDASVTPHE